MPLIASNIRPVNSFVPAIIHEVGRSRATTRIRRAVSSVFSLSQSALVRRDRRSTCSTSSMSPACAGEYFLATAVQMNLDPVAVVFDFANPLLALRRFGFQGGELGFNEPRHLNTLRQPLNSQK